METTVFTRGTFSVTTERNKKEKSVTGKSFWEITAPKDHNIFLKGLLELCPNDSIMCIEVSSLAKNIRKIFTNIKIEGKLQIRKGTIWPKSEIFHIPLTHANIDILLELLEGHNVIEFCDHFHVYAGDKIILEWYDAFTEDPLFILREIPTDRVEKFCMDLGSQHK